MNQISYEEIYDSELAKDAILHTHEPFVKDYLCIHSLIKAQGYGGRFKSIMEIGTHTGEGTKIICNALPEAKVYSLDLPNELSDKTKQHPLHKGLFVGEDCSLPYTQLYGDSMTFNYDDYLCEAWYIDGEHSYAHPRHETVQAIKQKAKLIIWHDADIVEVWNAINDSFEWNNEYELFRITGTRIAYALRNN